MLLYWYHYSHNGERIQPETDDDSIGGHFLHLLHGEAPSASWEQAMHASLILYAEHEFNASTFAGRVIAGTGSDVYSAIVGAIGALRGPKHGGANEVSLEIQQRYETPEEAEADIRRRIDNKEVVIGFGHPVYTVSDPRHQVIKEIALRLSQEAGAMKLYDIADRLESVMRDTKRCSPTSTGSRRCLITSWGAHRNVHAAVCHGAGERLVGAHHRATAGQQNHSPVRQLYRAGSAGVRTAGSALSADRYRVVFTMEPLGIMMLESANTRRPPFDREMVDIVDYVMKEAVDTPAAYRTAHYCLLDTLGCGLEALSYPACKKLMGPVVPGAEVLNGTRVPGTRFQLDPVQAAFNIGAMIRWLDFNDTWLAAEWGHPSDNLGGILAVADWLSRQAVAVGKAPLTMRQVLIAMIKAHEIQGCLALENAFNRVGLDHVLLVKVASTAVVAQLLGLSRAEILNAVSLAGGRQSLRIYRHAPNAGTRKSWAAGMRPPARCGWR